MLINLLSYFTLLQVEMVSANSLERLVKPWKPYAQKTYIFTNVNLIDPVLGAVHSGATVKISGGIIESVQLKASPATGTSSTPDDDVVTLDLQGKYLCPGLFDAHVHLTAVPGDKTWRDTRELEATVSALRQSYVCQAMLNRGFTSVRDCGGATLALKEAIKDGLIQGPRLFIAGRFLSQTGGHGDFRGSYDTQSECCGGGSHFTGIICDGVPQCLQGAREVLRTGSDFIKIMGGGGVASPTDHISHVQYTAEEIRAITTIASNNNTFVTSHAYTPKSIQQAINNGVLGIEHGNLIDKETAELMAEKGVYLTPTLVTYSTMASPKHAGYMPPEAVSKNLEVLEAGLGALKIAADAGVNICYGSDLLGHLGAAQSEEFSIRAQVLSPLAILQSATITPAKMMGQSEFLGQIKPGFSADLLILNSNPLEDITILSKPEAHILAVIKEGRVCLSRWGKLKQEIHHQPVLLE